MKLLLVDDEEPLRRLLRKHLETFGFDVVEAENGLEAIALAHTENPDCILMDVDMPKMNGIAAIQKLRENAVTKDLPVLVLTGSSTKENVLNATRAGADGVVVKADVNLSEFPGKIRRVVTEKRRAQTLPASEGSMKGGESGISDAGHTSHSGQTKLGAASSQAKTTSPPPSGKESKKTTEEGPSTVKPRSEWPLVPFAEGKARLKKAFELKALPFVASEIINITGSSHSDSKDLAETLQRDPAMAGQVLKLANSSLYGSQGRVRSLTQAVTKIGFGAVRETALAVSLIDEYRGAKMGRRIPLLEFWKHSLSAAVLAREIAIGARLNQHQVEEAFLGGLLNDVGQMALAEEFRAEYGQVVEVAALGEGRLHELEREAFGFDHPEVAEGVLRKWKFSDALIRPISLHHRPGTKGSVVASEQVRMTAILRLASVLANVSGLGSDGDDFVEEVPDAVLDQIKIAPEAIEHIMSELKSQVEDLTQILLLHDATPAGAGENKDKGNDVSGKRVALLSQAEASCDTLALFLKARGVAVFRLETLEEAGRQEPVEVLLVRWATADWLEEVAKRVNRAGVEGAGTRVVVLSERKLPIELQKTLEDQGAALLRMPFFSSRLLSELAAPRA